MRPSSMEKAAILTFVPLRIKPSLIWPGQQGVIE